MRYTNRSAIWLMAGLAPAAWAQQQTLPPEAPDVGPMFTLQAQKPEQRLNRFGLNYRMGLNISVDFKHLGGRAFTDVGPATGTTVNRTYDNGYNRVDSTGNNHGGYQGTWDWSYSNPNSFQGDHILVQSYSAPANASSNDNGDDPYHGLELTYNRQFFEGKHWRGGLETGLGYNHISIDDSRGLTTGATRLSDAYYGPGVEAWPAPPGPATYGGPGAVIDAAPTSRTTDALARAAAISGGRKLETELFTWRVGPYVEFPLTERLSAGLSGGLVLALAQSDFSYNEDVVITDSVYGGASASSHGSASQTDVLVGGYVGGSLSYALTSDFSLVAGAQFQALGDTTITAGNKQAVLNLGQSIFVSLGVAYSF